MATQQTAQDSSEPSNTISNSQEGGLLLGPIADEHPHGARLAVIIISLMLGMFLVALDNVSYRFSYRHHPKLTEAGAGARPSSARPSLESQTSSVI
jgi:hypothetical protein